eukprot:177376-Rhodomonas_salina.1
MPQCHGTDCTAKALRRESVTAYLVQLATGHRIAAWYHRTPHLSTRPCTVPGPGTALPTWYHTAPYLRTGHRIATRRLHGTRVGRQPAYAMAVPDIA